MRCWAISFSVVFSVVLAVGATAGEEGLQNADHWSFQPLRIVTPPQSDETNPIDAFVFAKLAENRLNPNPPATRAQLIRRLTFDLHGLPPTPEEIDAFDADPAADDEAVRKLIVRLLASPRYGERWARHWLDVVRYSESQGFERDKFRPNSWRYRDFVIESFNTDKRYDQFAREQIAGDVIEPVTQAGIVATGFLVAGPWDEVGNSQASAAMKAQVREEELEDMIGAVGQTFLGITINCARCHDHKYDPIPSRDYYAFKAVFEGIRHGERIIVPPAKLAESQPKIDALKKQLGDLEKTIGKGSTPKLIAERNRLRSELSGLEPKVYAANPQKPPPTHFLERGDLKLKGEVVTAGGLSNVKADLELPADAPEAQRRRAFANWMTSPENPLFARTIVNRVWHYHFGMGLVNTPNDLGVSGGDPSHPELLDWLAGEFIRGGYRLKKLHTMILKSKTWRQSSEFNTAAASVDADNRLLWRFAPKRLEAEVVRDSMLAISGDLNPKMGGPSDQPFDLVIDNSHFFSFKDGDGPEFNRRTIYRAQIASLRDSLLDSLDCPSIGLKTPARGNTSTPVQALSMMNNEFVDRQCRKLAARLESGQQDDVGLQIERAFRLVLGRVPTEKERQKAGLLESGHSLDQVCWALFNTSEFLFVK